MKLTQFIVVFLLAITGYVYALELDPGYNCIEITSTSQVAKGFGGLYKMTNVESGRSVVVGVDGIPASRSRLGSSAQVELIVTDDRGKSLVSAPLFLNRGCVSFTLEKDLWLRSKLNVFIDGKDLPEKKSRGLILQVVVPSYKLMNVSEFEKLGCSKRMHTGNRTIFASVLYGLSIVSSMGVIFGIIYARKRRR
jgi:hypothetical protein